MREIRIHDIQVIKRRRYRLRNLLIHSISEVQNHGTIIQRKTVLNLAQNVAQFGAQNSKCLLNCTPGIPTGLLEGNYPVVEGGDGGEHEEREAAREGHVQAETGPGAPRRPAKPRSRGN